MRYRGLSLLAARGLGLLKKRVGLGFQFSVSAHLDSLQVMVRLIASCVSSAILGFPAIVRASPTKTIGLSLPLTGVQAEIGKEMEFAYQMAMESAGQPFRLSIKDDGSKVEGAVENYRGFASDPSVVACSGLVGTPHAVAVVPIARAAGLPLVGIRSGASQLRIPDNTIWHLRSSYDDETALMVKDAIARGQKSIAILYSNDSFGESARDGMLAEMKLHGMKELITVAVDREGGNLTQACNQVATVLKSQQEATSIALLLITKPMVAACKQFRTVHRMVNPILAMSITANLVVMREPDPGLLGLAVVTAFPAASIE
jgi:ABC-type branched-subunit amino acid transport system substrate-binding protein